ncbi:MAG: mannose-1-phosphate guanyltransferase [Bacillota bacterium]|nr:mannose-1-phosphate guanyltransferase [Bacillota bacterium]
MKAVVMAGGKGTRLRPLTCDKPKPMVPVVGRPILEHIVRLLRKHGFTDIYATLHYMPEVIEEHFGTGEAFGVSMRYAVEDTPLGTAGSVKACEEHLASTFLVISGDALTDFDLAEAVEFHRARGAIATIVLTRVPTPLEYGVVITDDDGRISRFLEKPSWGEVFSDTVNTGIYVLEPEVLGFFDFGQEFDFSKNLFPLILKRKMPLFGYVASGYWSDIGTIDQYRQTHYDILEGRAKVDIPGQEVERGVYIGAGAEIHPNARLIPPAVIGDFSRVKRNAEVGDASVIGCQNLLNEGASVKRSVIWNNSYVGKEAELRGAIVCSRTSIKAKTALFEGSVVGADCSVGERSIIKPGVKIWPDKVIDAGTTITTSLVWGAKWSRRLFGSYGVSGLLNVEITPEFAAKLGAAYGACVGEKRAIVVSSDAYKPSRMLKRAITAGLLSSGTNVYDLGRMTTPVTRYAVAALGVAGGLHVRLSPYDPNIGLIEFLDEKGINIDRSMERKIENAFFSEDFRRVDTEDIGEVAFLTRVVEQYLDGLLKAVSVASVRARRFKVVVDFDPGNLSLLLPTLLDALGCQVLALNPDSVVAARPRQHFEMLDSLALLSRAVVSSRADLGIAVDTNAERLLLVDEQGRGVSEEMFCALMSLLILKSREGATVAVPVTAPRIIEELARTYRGRVIRTRANPRSVMEKVIEEKILIGVRELPGFQPAFDALLSLAKILEVMATENVRLSSLLSMVPQFYMSKRTVECPWEDKGRVMRTLIEETRSEKVELIDGIKVYHDTGWALILPDSEEPLFHVYSEASTPADAEALREMYMTRISEIRAT